MKAVIPNTLLAWMRIDLHAARRICREAQVRNGVAENTEGTVHHLPAIPECPSFLEFLDTNPADAVLSSYFQGAYILQSMGGNFNEGRNYASAVHRDIRSYQDPCPMLNTLVMLDEFTADNGSTFLMPGGHKVVGKPNDEWFNHEAEQVIAPAGSILIWNSNLWHRAGDNTTGKPRRIVTPIFTRPWYKPGFDYPRAIGYENKTLSEYQRQVLGYNARVPSTLDEWYRKPADRFYKGNQG